MSPYLRYRMKTLTPQRFVAYLNRLERNLVQSLVCTIYIKPNVIRNSVKRIEKIRLDKERIHTTQKYSEKDVEKYYS